MKGMIQYLRNTYLLHRGQNPAWKAALMAIWQVIRYRI
jgi:hypothetical protein